MPQENSCENCRQIRPFVIYLYQRKHHRKKVKLLRRRRSIMAKKIITITRQYGSGGREIGETLAKRLGVSFWDNKLLDVAAKDSGIHKTHFEESDERRTNSFLDRKSVV